MKSVGTFCLLALLCGVISWCGTGAHAAELAAGDHEVTDSHGRQVKVPAPFRRIISLYGAHTENLYTLGAAEQLIGVGRNEDWPPDAAARPVYSYRDGLEKFLAAKPDLVLIRPMIDRGYGRLIQRLEAHGVTVVSLQPGSLEQMFVYWTILGKLSGKPAEARRMIVRFKRTTARSQGRMASIALKKRVYFEAIHDRMRTFAPMAMPIYVLETAGGINIAADAAPRRGTNIADYGKERILSRSDEIDVYLAQVGPMNRPTVETIRKEPGFSLIRAVREGRIHLIDEKLVSRPTMRLLDGIDRIGRILYPDVVTEADGPFGRIGPSGREPHHIKSKEEQP